MKSCIVIFLVLIPTLVLADSLVDSVSISPENPAPMAPFRVGVVVALPDRCWEEGPIGDLEFTIVDSYTGQDCSGGIFLYWVYFEQDGLPEGHHSITVTEWHDSVRDPGSWAHVVEFTVGDPPVGNEDISWSAVKALYR